MEQSDIIAYNNWLENLNEPAPEGAWNSIADELDIADAWNGISEMLDLDEVWQNIEADLPAGVVTSNPSIHNKFPKLFWAAAALMLLTLTTPIADPEKGLRLAATTTVEPSMRIEATQPKPEILSSSASKVKRKDPPAENTSPSSVRSEQEPLSQYIPLVSTDSVEEVIQEELQSDWPFYAVQRKAISEFVLSDSTERLVFSDSLIVADIKSVKDSVNRKNKSRRPRWAVGIIGSVKNTWLINPETTSGLKRSSLNDTHFTFGKEFGITIQRSVGTKSSVQFEYYFFSEIGQRYHEYINALYQTKNIKLHYQKVQFVYRTRIFEKSSSPAFYGVAGLRISRLTLADASIGGEEEIVTQQYRPWDYGFLLGGEAEFELNDKLVFVTGLRASYGVRNIYLGNNQAQEEFNKTHTASVGLLVGVKYRIN